MRTRSLSSERCDIGHRHCGGLALSLVVCLAVAWVGCTTSETPHLSGASQLADMEGVECTNEQKCPDSEVCLLGICEVGGNSCQASVVTCSDPVPECPNGTVPSVEDGCWGNCIAPELCWALDDCAACERAELLCVELPRPFGSYFACSQRDVSECAPLACDCLGAVCGGELACDSVTNDTVKCIPVNAEGGAAGTQAQYY